VVTFTLDQALVRTILEHPADYPWRMQDIGLLALRLDDRRECRLHVWDPESCVGDPPVHDHPFDFTSTVIVGELVNTRYVEDPNGIEHRRHRYRPGDDDDRRTDSVRLAASATILSSGDRYRQPATELHSSRQTPGTVTLLQFGPFEERELTVCLAPDAPWVSALARPATAAEVKRITGAALDQFSPAAGLFEAHSNAV
jgi:hypothetical protein